MTRLIYSLLLFVILFLFSCNKDEPKKVPPKAVKGVLDLRPSAHSAGSVQASLREQPILLEDNQNGRMVSGVEPWNFEKDGVINLDGEWEFYWNEFLYSGLQPTVQPVGDPLSRTPNYIPVPGNWNQFADNGKPVGSNGYATYRLRILLPKLNTSLAFKILNASTAYTMYVNGEKFASNGSVGKDKDTSIPQSLSVISSIHNSKEELEIIFHVSNFHYSKGGLWLPINIGNEKAVREIRDKNLFLDIFLSGSILIMGLYHLVIYIQRKQDKSPLLFGIYCFIIVVRLLSTGEKYLTTIFPEIPFQLLIKIEYISFYLAVPIFSHFLYTIFPREVKEKILKFIWAIGILFAISVIVTSTEIFTRTVNAYQILTLFSLLYFLFIIGLAIFRKREGSKTIFVGCLIIIIGVVNDILYNRNILSTGNIFPQCLLGFTFFQSIMLSMRFSRSF
ncbi:MAG: 7TM-DISM domain-containing protein, partial [Leptospiraceae bacterium]|nr:7TM-DISM domain-containing protein [Leptospiraceae bacterium]